MSVERNSNREAFQAFLLFSIPPLSSLCVCVCVCVCLRVSVRRSLSNKRGERASKNNEAQGTKHLEPGPRLGRNFESGYVVTGSGMLGKFLHCRSSRLWEAVIKPSPLSLSLSLSLGERRSLLLRPGTRRASPTTRREFSPVPDQILRAMGSMEFAYCFFFFFSFFRAEVPSDSFAHGWIFIDTVNGRCRGEVVPTTNFLAAECVLHRFIKS